MDCPDERRFSRVDFSRLDFSRSLWLPDFSRSRLDLDDEDGWPLVEGLSLAESFLLLLPELHFALSEASVTPSKGPRL